MDTVDETNRLQRSWGPCSRSMRDDLKYILDIFRTSFPGDIIKQHEYRNHLMMITINCNDAIDEYLPINEALLAKKKDEKEQEKKAKNAITGFDDRDIYIIDTTELKINFNDSDKTRTYKQVFEKYNLLNHTYDNTIFKLYADSYNKTIYVRIETNIDNTFDIKTTEKKILNDTLFTVVENFKYREHGTEWIEKKNYKFTSIAIINDKEKAIDYNQQQLKNEILLKKYIEYLNVNHHLYKEKKFTRISETEDTFHSFLEYNGLLNDSNLKYIFKLLHYQLGQFSVYIYISKVDDNNYKIYNLKNVDLTDTVISSITKKFRVQHSNHDSEELTYELKVGFTYYKTKKEYDLTANRDFEEDEQDDEEDDVQYDNNSDLLSDSEIETIKKTIERQLEKEKEIAIQTAKQTAKQTAIQTAIQTGVNGGYAKSSKFKTKEVLGKLRRVYKIPNSKKEHIKHKGNLITVSEYKAVMKLKNKIYK